jgi:hypothetical protein
MTGTAVALILCAALLSVGFAVDGWPGVALCFLAAAVGVTAAVVNVALLRARR